MLQLFHLSVLANAAPRDFAAWLFVHVSAQMTLFMLRRSASQCRVFAYVPWKPLAMLLLLTFAIKLYSRAPYIANWLSEGLRATRTNEDLASGSLSIINVFFYPSAILLAFATIPRSAYVKLMACVGTMCVIDFIFLGTRNAPIFVLLFHVLASPVRVRFRQLVLLIILLMAFVVIFSYSTIYRTQESELGTFDWLVLFEFTGSTENLKIDPEIAQLLANNAPILLPAVFLSHYLTHSVAELALLLSKSSELALGGAYYLMDQFCGIGICSRADSLSAIEGANPRAGIYQTAWGSIFFDFGLLGAAIVVTLLAVSVIFWQRMHRYCLNPATALAALIVAISPIENFMYNGLGLPQVLTVFIACWLLRLFAFIRL